MLTESPTRGGNLRLRVLLFTVGLAVITYFHRISISQAAPAIQDDLKLSDEQMSLVFSAFTLAYGLFEIPGGWLSDKYGPRRVLSGVVVLWSVFTAATGLAWNFSSMVVCRFLFGTGQAACFPSITKVFTIWFPQHERVRAQGIMWFSARWGGAVTPLLVYWVFQRVSWRWGFALIGLVGIVWTLAFYFWFRDRPSEHPKISSDELEELASAESNAAGHADVPWKKLLASRTVWMLWLQYSCMAYGWYFYITWLPTYLIDGRGLDKETSALYAGLPLLFGGVGCVVAGTLSARLAQRLGSVATTRRTMAYIGMTGTAVMLVLSSQIANPLLAMVAMGMAAFATDLVMPGAWGSLYGRGRQVCRLARGQHEYDGQPGCRGQPDHCCPDCEIF